MRTLSGREKVIFGLCLIVVACYVISVGIKMPSGGKLGDMDGLIETEKRQYEKNRRIIDKAERSRNRYDDYAAKFRQLQGNEQVIASMIADIERNAEQYQLRISDLKPKRTEKKEDYNVFAVSLSIDSEFAQIISFLNTLQGAPHYFKVDEVSFDKGGQGEKSIVKTRLVLSKIFIP